MKRTIAPEAWPALGDLRRMGAGDVIACRPEVRADPLWARYTEAIAAAVSKGAAVVWNEGKP